MLLIVFVLIFFQVIVVIWSLPCCFDVDCEKYCGDEKYGICAGKPKCQTNKDKTKGKCKCYKRISCCDDYHCGCKKGFFAVCRNANCRSSVSEGGDENLEGHGLCDCIRHGCCTRSQCQLTCPKGSVLRCVGQYKDGHLCSTGRCICATTCAYEGVNIYNDCKTSFGFKCSANKEFKLTTCYKGKCGCSSHTECNDDIDCKGQVPAGVILDSRTRRQNYEQLICSPQNMTAYCTGTKGYCKCKPIDKCTAALCQVALKNELKCCEHGTLNTPEKKKGCADHSNKEYAKCVKNPDCVRDKENQWRLRNKIPCDLSTVS